MSKKVCILGAGPSLSKLPEYDMTDIKDVILLNDHTRTCERPDMVNKLKDKNIYIIHNSADNRWSGLNNLVFNKLPIKKCLTDKLKPNYKLHAEAKRQQKKHYEGGTLNNLGFLPTIAEDEPYLHKWRGPPGRNLDKMSAYDGRPIEHMPEYIEEYIIPVHNDNLICNISYCASLYAAIELQAEQLVYFGLDFYNNFKLKKAWYAQPPRYGIPEWWEARMMYEGEHMKALYDDYFTKLFPNISLEFKTLLEHSFRSPRITCDTVNIENPEIANQTWYSSRFYLT
jgi:hypothetical protein